MKKNGVYASLIVTKETRNNLISFCDEIDLNLADSIPVFNDQMLADTFHSSLIFSNQGNYLDVKPYQSTFHATPHRWNIIQSNDKRILLLELDSPELIQLHNYLKIHYDLTHNYPDFNPHISLHYDYHGDLPSVLPDFTIQYDSFYTKQLESKPSKQLKPK